MNRDGFGALWGEPWSDPYDADLRTWADHGEELKRRQADEAIQLAKDRLAADQERLAALEAINAECNSLKDAGLDLQMQQEWEAQHGVDCE